MTGLTNGTSYVFRVAAINGVGTGTYSVTSSAVIPQTPPAVPTAPGQPTELSGIAGDDQASLSWVAPSDNGGRSITTYAVEYSSNGGSTWTEFTHANSTATSLTVTGLTNGTSYVFRVAAINSVGTGTYSDTSAVVIPQAPATVPGQPTDLSSTAGNAQASLSWVAPNDNGGRSITTYKIEYSSNAGTTWSDFVHPSSTATSATVTGLTNGTSYVFRVAAINSVGTGTYSNISTEMKPIAQLGLSFGTRPVGVVLGEPAGTHSVSAVTSPSNTGQVIFASATPVICSVNSSSGALTVLAPGTCRITANNSGTANYSAAPQQTQDIHVTSGSLAGLNPEDLEFLTSASVVGSTSYTLSASSFDTQLTLTIPSNALPSGTLVSIYLNKNSTTAGESISSTSYFLNFVVGWTNTTDGSLPIATTPLVITAVNASIKKGMVGYGILNGVPTPLGTATSDGTITLYMTEDPLLVVAPTIPGSPTGIRVSPGVAQSSVVTWTVPDNDGGEPITSYVATASPGGKTCSVTGAMATSCTMNDLENGTTYTFSVHAINQVGPGNPSSASFTLGDPTPESPDETQNDIGVSGTAVRGTHITTGTPSASPSAVAQEMVIAPTQPTPAPEALPAPTVSPEDYLLLVSAGAVSLLVAVLVALLATQRRRRLAKRG